MQDNSSRAKGVRFSAPVEAKPGLGVVYVRYLTSHALCRNVVLTQHRDELVTVKVLLKDVLVRPTILCSTGVQNAL